jgi:hypothetical protein
LEEFNGGVITLTDESDLPSNAAVEAKNLLQVEDGNWAPRWGSDWFGTDTGATIDGAGTFTTDAGVTHLVVVAGGTVYRSTDDGTTWDSCTGGTFTASNHVKMKQIKSALWMVNGVDAMLRYNGTTTLDTFAGLTTPTGLSAGETGLTGTNFTYYYAIAAINDVGSTAASTEVSQQVSTDRDNWATDGTESIDLSWSTVTGASRYEIYVGVDSGSLFYLASTEDTSFSDDGSVAINSFLESPVDDTTTGPVAKDIEISGNRLWLTQDVDNPWRVFWGGTGTYQGRFSSFYGGGWIDLEKGGKERPQSVVHFQDGKGNSFLTVLTKDPEGNGSIWQIALETATVGTTSFTIPAATKLVGTVGTTSYRAVVKVANSILFPNQKGIYSLGPRPQLLNLLNTDEVSANIRPTYKDLPDSAIPGITGYFYDAKVFMSVPFGANQNSRIMVYDTERQNWSNHAFDFGVEGMFEYTDTAGDNHFLCWKPDGSRLIEIDENIRGDLGADFETVYTSPLIPLTNSRVGFAKVKRAFIELAQARGAIEFKVSGQRMRKSFSEIGSETIDVGVTSSGWSSDAWSSTAWSDSQTSPVLFTDQSLIRFIDIREKLGTIQFTIKTSSRNDYYILRSLYAEGFILKSQQPSTRRL